MENATIIYLIRSSAEDVNEIKESLSLLKKNFLSEYPYKIKIFRESDFLKKWEDEIKYIYPEIDFCEVVFEVPPQNFGLEIPEYFPHPTHGNGPIAWGHPGFNLGYRHMCRFMAGEIFKHPALSSYDWYLRLDTDSFILSKINFDPFQKMRTGGKVYGFNNIQNDHPDVVVDLYEESENYFKLRGITPINTVDKPKIFYTNFEICDLNWFRGKEYTEFYDFIDHLGGIYTKRWGDAPIRYIAVKSLLPSENILDFSHLIEYKHGCHREFEKKLTYK